MHSTRTTATFVFSVLFLFFLQSLSDFIEAIYAFGLLVSAFTIEVASIVLFFTPLLLIFFRKPASKSLLLAMAVIAMLGRLLAPMLDPGGKLVASGISVGAFMLFFPALLQNRQSVQGWQLASGLLLAVSMSILFRTANSSLDLSERGLSQWISWLLAVAAAIALRRTELLSPQKDATARPGSGGRITGLAVGLASIILMIYFTFASPAVISRWTEIPYATILIVLSAAFIVFSWPLSSGQLLGWLNRRVLVVWNLLFVLFLVLTILPHQITFPSDPSAYPLDAPAASSLGVVALLLMLVLSPILFLDFMVFAQQISMETPSLPQIGRSFAAAALFFLIMVFFHVFTTIYDYAPVIGPFFRDRFWFVYLLAGLGILLPALLPGKNSFPLGRADRVRPFVPLAVVSFALLSVISLSITTARPALPPASTGLKLMTYNIQQSFDERGNKNLEGQLAVIRNVNPDILGLQESDTARVANGNVDAVRYFADNLDMYSYYGPTTTTGTFGIALLSKYPIQNPKTFFMYSEREQTATIHAEVSVNGKTYQVLVTHLGNGGPMVQLEDMLTRTEGLENVIAMGDFNFRPPTEQYAAVTQTLADAWLLKWPNGKEIPGLEPGRRIDHILVSPEMAVSEAEYVVNPASDHPYMYVVIQP